MGNKHPSNDLIAFSQGEFPRIDNQTSIDSFLFSPNEQQTNHWVDVTEQNVYYRIQYGKFNVYRNNITFQQIQKYKLVLKDKQFYHKFTDISKWRNNSTFIPKIQRIIVLNQTQICVSQFQLNIFMQRIPLRLADLTDIPFPQNLYFLTAILKGYKYIFDSVYITKMFQVTQTMIGVNAEGEVKVWWSSNLIEMDAMDDDKKQGFVSEEEFVRRVIDLVEDNTDERDYPYPFRKYLKQRNIPINGDFTLIINQVYTYAKQLNIIIPKSSFSVRDILKRDESNKIESQTSLVSNDFGLQSKNKGIENSIKERQSKNKLSEGERKASIEFNNSNGWLMHDNHPVEAMDFHHKPSTPNIFHKQEASINPAFTITHPLNGNFNYPNHPQFHYQTQQTNTHHINKQENIQNYAIHRLGQNIIQLTNTQPSHYQNRLKHYPQQYHTPAFVPNYLDNRNQQPERFFVGNNNPRVQFNKNTSINNKFMVWNHQKQADRIEINKNIHNQLQQPYGDSSHSITGKQIVLNPGSRFNLGQSQNQFSYIDLNQPTANLPFQKSTPTFSQTITPNFSCPTIYSLPINNYNNKTESPSYFSVKQPYSKQKPQFIMSKGVNVEPKKPNVQKQINSNDQLNGKLKYYARKDSQQTLDPEIASDLAKYLN